MIGDIKTLLLIPHLKVHNANALSSPFTIGFPAMTAWLGATHALQRKLNHAGFDKLRFNATAVTSHQCDLQTHKGVGDYVHSIIGTGNPLDKTGARSAFIEEARCHLNISLLIDCSGVSKDDEDPLLDKITHCLMANMKIAGGDILDFNPPKIYRLAEGDDKNLHQITRQLMPGYAIIDRRELMQNAMQQGQDAIEALLDFLAIHHSCDQDDNEKVSWTSKRKIAGWIVPIATGFHGISDLGEAKNQRDPDTPHRFAESVVTLGEFKMPHQIKSINEILWQYQVETENNLYLCQQVNQSY